LGGGAIEDADGRRNASKKRLWKRRLKPFALRRLFISSPFYPICKAKDAAAAVSIHMRFIAVHPATKGSLVQTYLILKTDNFAVGLMFIYGSRRKPFSKHKLKTLVQNKKSSHDRRPGKIKRGNVKNDFFHFLASGKQLTLQKKEGRYKMEREREVEESLRERETERERSVRVERESRDKIKRYV
jgi:hypothetical protein